MHSNNKYPEDELSAQLKQNDQHAFKQLYDTYAPALYSVILHIVSDKEKADKVLVEVFHAIYKNIYNHDPSRERLFTWMLTIARQASVKETMPFYQQELHHASLTREKVVQSITRSEPVGYGLGKVMDRLTDEHKILIHLCYFKNCSEDEIAEILNMPLETVRASTRIALSALRNLLM